MPNTHRIVKSLLTVFLDDTGSTSFTWANMQPYALAQSYSVDTQVATQNLVPNDLADPDGTAQWADPEPTEKSWTVTIDNLVVLPEATNPNYDPAGKKTQADSITALKAGTYVWVAVTDAGSDTGDTVPLYGRGLVTAYNQSGSTNEYHTASATITGQGELLDSFVIA